MERFSLDRFDCSCPPPPLAPAKNSCVIYCRLTGLRQRRQRGVCLSLLRAHESVLSGGCRVEKHGFGLSVQQRLLWWAALVPENTLTGCTAKDTSSWMTFSPWINKHQTRLVFSGHVGCCLAGCCSVFWGILYSTILFNKRHGKKKTAIKLSSDIVLLHQNRKKTSVVSLKQRIMLVNMLWRSCYVTVLFCINDQSRILT